MFIEIAIVIAIAYLSFELMRCIFFYDVVKEVIVPESDYKSNKRTDVWKTLHSMFTLKNTNESYDGISRNCFYDLEKEKKLKYQNRLIKRNPRVVKFIFQ